MQVRREVYTLLEQHRGVLKPEHFDGGVICHLQKRSEAAAAAALREIGRRTDFSSANNKPAFLTHWLMKLAAPEDSGSTTAGQHLSSRASCAFVIVSWRTLGCIAGRWITPERHLPLHSSSNAHHHHLAHSTAASASTATERSPQMCRQSAGGCSAEG